jgi:flagellar hook-length control protein FliK
MSGLAALAPVPVASPPSGAISFGAPSGASRGAPPGAPPGGLPEAPQGAPPGESPFHSELATHWARTATAEGHQSNSPRAGRDATSRAHDGACDGGSSVALAGIATANGETAGGGALNRAAGNVASPQDGLEPPAPTSTGADALAVGESVAAAVAVAVVAPTLLRQSDTGVDSPGSSPAPEASVRGVESSRMSGLSGQSDAAIPASGALNSAGLPASLFTPAPRSSSAAGPDPASPFAAASPSAAAPEAVSAPVIASTPVPASAPASASAPVSASTAATASTAASASASASVAAFVPASASAPTSTPTSAGLTFQGAERQRIIVAGALSGMPATNLPGLVYSAEAQGVAAANSSWSGQDAVPKVLASRSGARTAPAVQNGADVRTGERSAGSGRFLANAGQGRATGFDVVTGGSTPSAAQAQPQSVLTAPVPTSASSGQPTSVASVPTPAASAETSAQSAASIGAQAQTATPSAGASTSTAPVPLLASGVPMQEVIDSIHATVAMAARQGIAQARIELQPQELGQISIRLSQTSAGLSARVSADTPAGAQALTQGGSELRQSLSSLGVSLLRLDIGSSGQSQAREHEERFSRRAGGSSASIPATTPEGDEMVAELDGGTRPSGAARGEIIDVLA